MFWPSNMVGSILFNGLVVNHGFDHRFCQGFPANGPVNLSNDAWNCRKLPVKLMIRYSLFKSNDLLLIFRSSTKIKPRGKMSHLDFLGSYQHGIPKGFQTDPSLHGLLAVSNPLTKFGALSRLPIYPSWNWGLSSIGLILTKSIPNFRLMSFGPNRDGKQIEQWQQPAIGRWSHSQSVKACPFVREILGRKQIFLSKRGQHPTSQPALISTKWMMERFQVDAKTLRFQARSRLEYDLR